MNRNAKYKFLKTRAASRGPVSTRRQISHIYGTNKEASFGFGNAGKTINLVSAEDIQQVIDRAHERVYGESRASRIERLKPIEVESGEPDWDAFDSPTYERKLGKAED